MPKASGSLNKPVRIANPRAVTPKLIKLTASPPGPHHMSRDHKRTSTGSAENGAAKPQQVY